MQGSNLATDREIIKDNEAGLPSSRWVDLIVGAQHGHLMAQRGVTLSVGMKKQTIALE